MEAYPVLRLISTLLRKGILTAWMRDLKPTFVVSAFYRFAGSMGLFRGCVKVSRQQIILLMKISDVLDGCNLYGSHRNCGDAMLEIRMLSLFLSWKLQ